MSGMLDNYDGFAKYYDSCFEPLLGRARTRVAELCYDLCAKNVLDICCGTGKQMEHYAALGMNAYGVDLYQGMLNVAKVTANKVKGANFSIVHADATHLPFADGSFDVATVSLALHEMPMVHAEALVLDALRVAKTLVILDYCMAERNIEVPAASLAFVLERIVGGEHYQNYRIFMRQGAVEGLITRLGLQRVARHKVWAGAGVIEVVQRSLVH